MKKVITKTGVGGMVKKGKDKTPAPSGSESFKLSGFRTGNETVDLAIRHHEQLINSVQDIVEAMRNNLKHLRSMSESSSGVSRALAKFYHGTPEQGRLMGFQDAHEELDSKIPESMIVTAVTHIVQPLEEFVKKLEDATKEIKHFKELHNSHEHYKKKVSKLQEEQRKRQQENKPEKQKQGEKLSRNMTKLQEAEVKYKQMSESLVSCLMRLNDSRLESMNPIFVKVVQFEQEYYKRCHNTMAKYDVKSNPAQHDPHRRPSNSALGAFDNNGNRITAAASHGSVLNTSQLPPTGTATAHHFGSSGVTASQSPATAQHFGSSATTAPPVPNQRPLSQRSSTPPIPNQRSVSQTTRNGYNEHHQTTYSQGPAVGGPQASSLQQQPSRTTQAGFDPFANMELLQPTPMSTSTSSAQHVYSEPSPSSQMRQSNGSTSSVPRYAAGPTSTNGTQNSNASYGGAQPVSNYNPPVSSYGGAQPSANGYGGAQPSASSYGGTQHSASDYGGAQPSASSYGGTQPSASSYGTAQQYNTTTNSHGVQAGTSTTSTFQTQQRNGDQLVDKWFG